MKSLLSKTWQKLFPVEEDYKIMVGIYLFFILYALVTAYFIIKRDLFGLMFIFPLLFLCLFLISFNNPIFILKCIIVYVFIQYTLKYSLHLPPRITLVDDILFFLLIGVLILKKQGVFKLKYYLTLPIILIIITGIISGVVNNSPFYVTLLGLRGYLQYAFLFFVIMNLNIKKKQLVKLSNFFIDVFLGLQISMMLYQIITAIREGHLSPDTASGTFSHGGANYLTYATTIPLFFIIGRIIEEKQYDFKNRLRLFLLLFVFIFSQGRFAIVLSPFIFIFIYRDRILKKKIVRKWTFRFFLFFGLLFGLYLMFTDVREIKMYNLYQNFIRWEHDISMGANRYLWLGLVWKYVSKSWKTLLIGYGPGEFWSYISYKLKRPLTMETYNYWGQVEAGVDAGCATGLVPAIGEFGFLGLFLFLWLFYKNYRWGWNLFKNSPSLVVRAYSLPVIAGSIMMILGVYVHLIWESQNITFFYWFFTGLMYKIYIIEKEERRFKVLKTHFKDG